MGANQNARKLLSTDLVNTNYCYRQKVSWERFLVIGKHVQYIFLEQGLLFKGIFY